MDRFIFRQLLAGAAAFAIVGAAAAQSYPGKPAGTPGPVVMKLNSEFAKVMANPTIKQRLSESGFEPQTSSPEQFAAYMKSEIAKWQKVIRDSNISLD
jgi:tripartite-type tricarboxylate transporter receptor subunit TctC